MHSFCLLLVSQKPDRDSMEAGGAMVTGIYIYPVIFFVLKLLQQISLF